MGFWLVERRALEREIPTIKIVLEKKTLELREEAWSCEKAGRELHTIYPRPQKDDKVTQRFLHSRQCPSSTDENGKNQS